MPTYTYCPKPTYLDPSRPSFLPNQSQAVIPSQPVSTIGETTGPSHLSVEPVSQDPGLVERQFTDSQPAPHFQPHPPGIVMVDEDLDENNLESPEGIAVDHVYRLLFWTDSLHDTVEVSQLNGSQRCPVPRDLVNPRPIVTNLVYGQLYWADWNRDGLKIEMSNMDGTDQTILVKDDL
ncbi:Low-density lipoprotein receptor-related protein 8 [Takifugu flavidus]|uniref:Low-density lipoprotein receptor-related protein 8 n=1 Tax=Takifugu flavidus TaxID=433684 RepID=A0A5C6MYK9_9TELE|nr:Low-density lipoprotein receptor-related protein 8 [Takifugu flavidus]